MPNQAIGFWRGFMAPFGAARLLLGLPRAWPLMLVPFVAFVALEGAVVGASWHYLKPWVQSLAKRDGRLDQIGVTFASFGAVALVALAGWFLAGLLAPIVSAPALERIVGIAEAELGAPPRSELGVLSEFWCGVRSFAVSTAFTLPLLFALTLLDFFVPPASALTTPAKLFIAALGLAWGLFDYPLTLRGIGMRERVAFVRRNFVAVLGFGLAFLLVFMLPCCNVVLLPVAVAAATRLYWEIRAPELSAGAAPRLN